MFPRKLLPLLADGRRSGLLPGHCPNWDRPQLVATDVSAALEDALTHLTRCLWVRKYFAHHLLLGLASDPLAFFNPAFGNCQPPPR
jgi:hypothetical protein